MIIDVFEKLKLLALSTKLVKQSAYGDIVNYMNKHDILYPYVNFDIITYITNNFSKDYKIRMYVCDRNKDKYISYNKADIIINNFLKDNSLDIENYEYTFFDLDYDDMINGAYCDFLIEEEVLINTKCDLNIGYIITEYGDYIITEDDNKIVIE